MHFQDVLKAHRVLCVRAALVRGDPLYKICFRLVDAADNGIGIAHVDC